MLDEITITRKYVIYPIASDMKEWERKVIKYVSENYEKRIQLLEQKIKHSKIPKEEKENLRKELDNLKIKYDAFQADPRFMASVSISIFASFWQVRFQAVLPRNGSVQSYMLHLQT